MWCVMSAELREEVARYALRFTCEHCANFIDDVKPGPNDPTGRGACSLLYPTKPHRDATLAATPDGERVFFCKMFEGA